MLLRYRADAARAVSDRSRELVSTGSGIFVSLFAAGITCTSDSNLEYLRHSGSDKFKRRSIYA